MHTLKNALLAAAAAIKATLGGFTLNAIKHALATFLAATASYISACKLSSNGC
jgi:hypothetical protein